MKRLALAILGIALAATLIAQAPPTPPAKPAPAARFLTCDVLIDSGPTPLAAWQVDVRGSVEGGGVELVGVEGGSPGEYAKPAYYDPDALTHDRIVLAAFSTAKPADLPTGKSRVARLHLRATGDHAAHPAITITLITAADPTGAPIHPTATTELGDTP